MKKDTVLELKKPEVVTEDPLTEICRKGAREMLTRALEDEVERFLEQFDQVRDSSGKRMVTRNGYLPERTIQTGIGDITVKAPRVADRRKSGAKVRFTSSILPPYLRRTKSIEDLLPWLYLKGVSTGDFSEALAALLGKDAPGLSASTISRLKEAWSEELKEWQQRSLKGKEYVYFWVDGVHFGARMEDAAQCMLVIIGATKHGDKELLTVVDGYRESEQSWLEALNDLKRRGLVIPPKLAVGDGALGFWKALPQVFGDTRRQRCWMHKTGNVLDKLPKHIQARAKDNLHQIWMAETKEKAEKAFDHFVDSYEAKYPKASECLAKDRDVLLTFYDFPAEHWIHLRTTNPIESTFATVRLRTAKTRGMLTRDTMLTMVFKLSMSAQKRWRRLNRPERLGELIQGIKFVDGIKQEEAA
ncbi:IS256 family transposase [Candidatus Obscuribacterales bacterium]|nr:IS256 family transposase [Candidatus Obscuribacterales bacterium]MBX3076095.1 IS256 family transposase [Candidatus Obscuribacterales bacterium]MBX3076136.1 IS256 family transposase [Candidatus Obscuribacterales bacterium]MBX3138874.1 IS256 family transposase [Candidatus Obscuribacterales bacterium]MBX3152656.1 IS256 family transposase [Candidatus Obscuribacterales bacterium]